VVTVADMAHEDRWGDYPRRAVEAGICSSLSLPLTAGEGGRGALNLYSSRPHAFTGTDERTAHGWAGQASGALSVALRMADREDAVEHLHRGLVTRQVIGQAVGLLMAQRRCTAEEAFDLLRSASQRGNEKLRDVAARLVAAHDDEARDRAR
jgi:GAF domain-containing protein